MSEALRERVATRQARIDLLERWEDDPDYDIESFTRDFLALHEGAEPVAWYAWWQRGDDAGVEYFETEAEVHATVARWRAETRHCHHAEAAPLYASPVAKPSAETAAYPGNPAYSHEPPPDSVTDSLKWIKSFDRADGRREGEGA